MVVILTDEQWQATLDQAERAQAEREAQEREQWERTWHRNWDAV